MTDTKVKTTLEAILKGNELKQFRQAEKTWKTLPNSAMNMLKRMGSIGQALNTVYDRGLALKLSRQDVTDLVREHFEGLNRRERSEYRKLAKNYEEIRLFVEFEGIKSANPTYLVNAWLKAVKDDWKECEVIERTLRGGYDVNGNIFGQGVSEGATTGKKVGREVSVTPEKKGFDNIVKHNELTADEVTTQLGFIVNQVKTLYNGGKLKAEHLTTIEKHLTTCLYHINDVDDEAQVSATG